MTRKKSNVKALALAVTCAILAGGGIGLEPVYAVDALYKENSTSHITADATGATGNTATATKWKLTVIDSGLKIGGIDLGLTKKGAITAGSLTLGTDYDVKQNIEDAKAKINTVEGNLTTNQNNLSTLEGRVGVHDTKINALETKTQGITRGTDGDSTTVDGVNFKEGAVVAAGVAANSITANNFVTVGDTTNGYVHMTNAGIAVNGRLYSSLDPNATDLKSVSVAEMANTRDNTQKISYTADGTKIDSDVIINKDKKNQVKITEEEGIVVGLNSSVINDDGVFAGGHNYANAKAALNANDGSIKGANGKFGVDKDGNVTTEGDIQGADITATGALKGKTLGIGTIGSEFTVDENGNTTVGGTLDVTGATTLGSTLNVAGKTTLSDELQVDKKATFGNATGLQTVIEGGNITAGGMLNSESAKIGSVGIDNTGAITGVTSLTTDALTVTGAFTTGNLTVNGDLTASGAINGKTISIKDGGSIAGVNFETGGKLTATTGTIGGVSFAAGGVVSGVNNFTSTIIRDGAGTIITKGNVESKTAKIGAISIDNEKIEGSSATGLTIENVKIKDGVVSDVTSLTANSATIGGVNTLDNTGITVATGKKIQVGSKTVIEDGSIAVSTNTKLTDQALNLNTTNTWTAAGGLVADKATVNGVVLGADGAAGKATFTDADNKSTTIAGDKITTGTITADKLLIDKISLGKDGNDNISIDKDGDVTTKGEIKITDTAGNVMSTLSHDKATFGKDAANQTVIEKGTVRAKAKSDADQQAGLTFNENGLTVNGQNAEGKISSFSFNAKTGDNTFTDKDGMTTTINGSSVRSFNSATGAGHLNGATLNLWKDNDNSTYMTAGGVTFNGAAGEKGGKTTTINGGTITTDTLNVERINLGEDILDSNGNPHGSNLSMDKQGNFSAAGGNFKVTGGSGADKGAFTNTVGNTTFLQTDNAGASMKFNNTAATGGVESKVTVEANKATVAAGDKASFVAAAYNGGTATITGGTQTVTTTDKGTVFENSDHNTPFGGGSETKTTINGNEITTGKITTDQLVIKGNGSGDADGTGNGSIALGGDGSIKSNIKDTTTGIESTFETKADKISSVITGGTVELRQELDANTGKITNKAGDMSTELDNNGFTVKQNGKTDVKIADGDVTVTNNKNEATPNQKVQLSDLGSLNNLDDELKARDEYNDNKTAVGAINAEAGIRREEVARLDNRINDVNDRVNKVGAMAAAIASLKSIGYDPQAPSEFSIGLGQYKGETGVAMGFFHYPNKNFMINVSLSTAGGETMGGIGATWRFGHKSPQKLLDEQREAQAKKELAAAEKYQAAAKLAKEAQERAEYAAKLARQAQVSADNAKAAADATQAKHFGE